MKYLLTFPLLLVLALFCINTTYADTDQQNEAPRLENTLSSLQESIREEIKKQEKQYIFLSETYHIDMSSITPILKEIYPHDRFSYVWEIFWDEKQTWEVLDITFSSVGRKQISLHIFKENSDAPDEKIHTISLFPFVYTHSIPYLIDPNTPHELSQNYIQSAEDIGILILILNKEKQDSWEVVTYYNQSKKIFKNISDYIGVWGSKDFIFNTITELQSNQEMPKNNNFVLISWYNNKILQNYIENSLSGKNIVKQGFIIDELNKSQILKHPTSFQDLEQWLKKGAYEYTPLQSNIRISPVLFVSHFINHLSNTGIKNTDIYLILLIPIFLTFVAIGKHIIWFSTLWNIIPVFLALMFLKIWLIFSLFVFWFLLLFNIFIARLLNKYTLLYTPKVVCIMIANILFFMLFSQLVGTIDFIDFSQNNILYIVIFFIICEKLISIITTKEFREYKKSIWWTLAVSLFCFSFFFLDNFLIFLFAYPEILLILIPFNFFLAQFTGLRITEYFRFWDIMKNIEEE